jgi:hypothetical protein
MEEKLWVGQGIRYGTLATLFTVVPSALNDYVVYKLPHTMVIDWVAGLITLILMGLAVAAILKRASAV